MSIMPYKCGFRKLNISPQAWASLLEGQNIIMGGAHWQVMNGKNIKLWVDRWLTALPTGHPSPLAGVQFDQNQTVDSLIYQQSFLLNLKQIRLSILSTDHLAILETCIGVSQGCDLMVWPWVNGGMFLVRSEYHWKCSHGVPSTARHSFIPRQVGEFSWNKVQKMHVPPKVMFFFMEGSQGCTGYQVGPVQAFFLPLSDLSYL